jgi:hypothetical protein
LPTVAPLREHFVCRRFATDCNNQKPAGTDS